jgi:hypothetical protein
MCATKPARPRDISLEICYLLLDTDRVPGHRPKPE